MNKKLSYIPVFAVATVAISILMSSCNNNPQSPGYEYMPDMYRSPAVEAYVDYGMDPYRFDDSVSIAPRSVLSARKPAPGTIAFSSDPAKAMYNFPYIYTERDADYEAAGALKNPIPFSEGTLAEGKELYSKFCVHCHGKTGKGDGPVVENGGFPTPGAYDSKLKDVTEGKMFHVITHGKGLMGSHAQQLSKEERWKVIHYVQSLQGSAPAGEGSETAVAADAEQ